MSLLPRSRCNRVVCALIKLSDNASLLRSGWTPRCQVLAQRKRKWLLCCRDNYWRHDRQMRQISWRWRYWRCRINPIKSVQHRRKRLTRLGVTGVTRSLSRQSANRQIRRICLMQRLWQIYLHSSLFRTNLRLLDSAARI